MRILGWNITRAPLSSAASVPVRQYGLTGVPRGAWFPVIREPYPGAWQKNDEIRGENVLANSAVFSCITLIAADIAKCRLRLVEEDQFGIWTETSSPAFSPVLRKPNRYQTIVKFCEQWIASKLSHGNTYALKQRDGRGLVVAMYVLDPTRVQPLIAPDGSVYYQFTREEIVGEWIPERSPIVPASEILHDLMIPLFHPLVGVSPIFACALAAIQGLTIVRNSTQFFANGSAPSGVLTAPGAIDDSTAARAKEYWEANFTGANVGRVAVFGDGMKYEGLTMNATDSQLIEQLKWTVETVCSTFHVPAALIDSSHQPPYTSSSEPLLQQYYSQCLQSLMRSMELTLDEGLELPSPYGTEFDIDDLIWLDASARTKAAGESIGSGGMAPNEARKKYFGLGPVPGGNTPYLQQQYFSLAALAARDRNQPFVQAAPATPPAALPPAEEEPAPEPEAPEEETAAFDYAVVAAGLREKALTYGWDGGLIDAFDR